MSEEFPGIWEAGVDSAVLWPSGKAYFFRDKDIVVVLDDSLLGVANAIPEPPRVFTPTTCPSRIPTIAQVTPYS